jgi:hypothetical protein
LYFDAIFLFVTIPCAAISGVLLLWVLARLRRIGYRRSGFNWPHKDFRLYAIYWRVAGEHGWSRWPLIAAGGFFFMGFAALLFSK